MDEHQEGDDGSRERKKCHICGYEFRPGENTHNIKIHVAKHSEPPNKKKKILVPPNNKSILQFFTPATAAQPESPEHRSPSPFPSSSTLTVFASPDESAPPSPIVFFCDEGPI